MSDGGKMEEVEFSIDKSSRLTIADIQALTKQAWADMRSVGTLAHSNAQEAGIDVGGLPEDFSKVLNIRPAAAGIGTVDLLVVALGPIAWDIWKYVVLPHIREKWGDNAIKAKKAAAKAAAKKSK